jgi:hypothetical protein
MYAEAIINAHSAVIRNLCPPERAWLAHPSVLALFKSPEDDNEPSSRVPAFLKMA